MMYLPSRLRWMPLSWPLFGLRATAYGRWTPSCQCWRPCPEGWDECHRSVLKIACSNWSCFPALPLFDLPSVQYWVAPIRTCHFFYSYKLFIMDLLLTSLFPCWTIYMQLSCRVNFVVMLHSSNNDCWSWDILMDGSRGYEWLLNMSGNTDVAFLEPSLAANTVLHLWKLWNLSGKHWITDGWFIISKDGFLCLTRVHESGK
jgi:hypothetical protein